MGLPNGYPVVVMPYNSSILFIPNGNTDCVPPDQCFLTFLLQRNPKQAWRSLTEPYALIRASSDVREVEATLISLAGQSPMGTTKRAKMTNYDMKFDCFVALRWVSHEEQ